MIANTAGNMKNIKVLLAVLTLSFATTACSKGGVGALKKLKDEACACKDKACAEEVNKKLDSAVEDLAKGGEPSKSDGEAIMEAMTGASACLVPLMTGK
jgi:hypothetical protein